MTTDSDTEPSRTPDQHLAAVCTLDNFKMVLRALKFYADPGTYYGVKVIARDHCPFASDLSNITVLTQSKTDGHTTKQAQIPFPGYLARTTLRELLEYDLASDTDDTINK